MDYILFERAEGVAYLKMNRPDKYNSMIHEMAMEMIEAFDQIAQDDEIRAVVISGEGKAFCAGQDLKEATDNNEHSIESIIRSHFNPIVRRIVALEKPVIAAVNGVAAGAGANLAFACDLTIAKSSANFIQAFSMIGLIPDTGGTYFLPRLIGQQKASALMMLGDKIKAEEAEKMGMIYKVVTDEEFEEEVTRTATKLAKMPTKGLALTKKALWASRENNLYEQLDLELKLQIQASNTEDYKEGTSAFLEKRKPTFIGK